MLSIQRNLLRQKQKWFGNTSLLARRMIPASPTRRGKPRMAAVVCHGINDYRLDKIDIPVGNENDVIIRVKKVGISDSDLQCYVGNSYSNYNNNNIKNGIIGHEFVGTVADLGYNAKKKYNNLEIEDQVVIGICLEYSLLSFCYFDILVFCVCVSMSVFYFCFCFCFCFCCN